MPADEQSIRTLERLRAVEERVLFQNSMAQAHSRFVLQRLGAPATAWPNYTLRDGDMLSTAHYLLWNGLQLKRVAEHEKQANEYIKQGAEALEFLYAQKGDKSFESVRQLFNAALGYYISGYYARAYVLMHDLSDDAPFLPEMNLFRQFFLRNLGSVRRLILAEFENPSNGDTVIARGLRDATLTEDEAIQRILNTTLYRAFSFLIEYPKSGQAVLLDVARRILHEGTALATTTRFVDWWWTFFCAEYVLDEYSAYSLWLQLSPLNDDDLDGRFVRPYIRAAYKRSLPVIELWPSQVAALPRINEDERRSYCLKMPTSSGKTRIAELAILRFLLDYPDPEAICVYIAPFRSLAVEVEQGLRKAFHPIGVRVSEMYGGFELSPIDMLILEQSRVIVVTPEKFDALLRYSPEVADRVRLIIIDEGHIIKFSRKRSKGERGLRFEFFLHRLVRRFQGRVRFLFISAVLPNQDEFAELIAGDSGQLIEHDWRPSRLLIGELRWDGRSVRVEYTRSNYQPLGHPCFIPNFVQLVDPRRLKGIRYRNTFPGSISEVVAAAAIRLGMSAPTMVFCAQKRSAEPLAREVLKALRIYAAQTLESGQDFTLPIDERQRERLDKCVQLAQDTMGDELIIELLRKGVIVHHAGIPQALRIELEGLARDHVVNLIIASTTLAHGVNLPIQSVIVYGLNYDYDQTLTSGDFWNICGRAGRGMCENEGQILFAVDLHKPDVRLKNTEGLTEGQIKYRIAFKRRQVIKTEAELRQKIIDSHDHYYLQSALLQLLNRIQQAWADHTGLDIAALCQRLAEHDLAWIEGDDKSEIEDWLEFLDSQLLALTEETLPDEITPDLVQEVMRGSLAYLQAGKMEDAESRLAILRDILYARVCYVRSQVDAAPRRNKYYRLGLPLADCRRVEDNEEALLKLLLLCNGFENWDFDTRYTLLSRLLDFLFSLEELSPDLNDVGDGWTQILRLWIRGLSPKEIVEDVSVSSFTSSPAQVSAFIEDAFVYKAAWGLNALVSYFTQVAQATELALPSEVRYLSALVKYGVYSPVASALLAIGVESRKLAIRLAEKYANQYPDPNMTVTWFLALDTAILKQLGCDENETREILLIQDLMRQDAAKTLVDQTVRLSVRINGAQGQVAEGDSLLMRPRPDSDERTFSLYTLQGSLLGTFEFADALPLAWDHPEHLELRIEKIQITDTAHRQLEVVVEVV